VCTQLSGALDTMHAMIDASESMIDAFGKLRVAKLLAPSHVMRREWFVTANTRHDSCVSYVRHMTGASQM
jgi:hypothetical protein